MSAVSDADQRIRDVQGHLTGRVIDRGFRATMRIGEPHAMSVLVVVHLNEDERPAALSVMAHCARGAEQERGLTW